MKTKKESSRNEKKSNEEIGRDKKTDEKDAGDENQSRRCSSEVIGFLREKLEQDGEFRSEDLQ